MSSEARQRKMADRIKVIVAGALEFRIKDPRLGFITITDVRVTPDLREASVFYTVYGDDEARASTAAALASAKGVLRSEVGKQTGIKFTPTLEFIPDAIPETARQLEDLLKQAAMADAEVHAQAAGASFAGDPDPYRRAEADEPGGGVEGVEHDRPDAASA
ncbi:MAG: 30S ribosome-binding factor RbfA [Actinomycetota bacterium]|jgi:ribosome-binding factor A|nr:30S ribosome-binding factor RbfA [Actinomycetota bacterium]